jgi:hypothetical protein
MRSTGDITETECSVSRVVRMALPVVHAPIALAWLHLAIAQQSSCTLRLAYLQGLAWELPALRETNGCDQSIAFCRLARLHGCLIFTAPHNQGRRALSFTAMVALPRSG